MCANQIMREIETHELRHVRTWPETAPGFRCLLAPYLVLALRLA
jgi:hypothetical protein